MERLKNKIVGLDTMVFIYHFENNQKYSSLTFSILDSLEKGRFNAIISSLTLLEILVKPKRENNQFINERYKLILQNFPNLEIKPMDIDIAEIAATIRGQYNINTPDAIQVATAIHSEADIFITNDFQLERIPGIEILLLDNM
ncbi:MAG: PIN domain-containing protein [Atribacterota bacterium]|mgnify:CR=1 FL=1|jgi:predicted nucleic acid-binding protein|nr:PIN domain-containing protein [Atribacterota bacterium]MDI9596237.1 PIN domain-containing protein [Atribacterota bacterium]